MEFEKRRGYGGRPDSSRDPTAKVIPASPPKLQCDALAADIVSRGEVCPYWGK